MPTAAPELRAKMKEYFGSEIGDAGPIAFLEKEGYVLMRNWNWKPKPGVGNYDQCTDQEYECIQFLCQEWDMGGIDFDAS